MYSILRKKISCAEQDIFLYVPVLIIVYSALMFVFENHQLSLPCKLLSQTCLHLE